jgi:predicted glycosyltransferase
MLLYYAAGGGLGHLTRARAFLHAAGAEDEAVVLTASPFASDRRVMGSVASLIVPEELRQDQPAYRDWLQRSIARLAPERLIVDTFPAGLFHEFAGMAIPCEIDYVARYLEWRRYAPRELPSLATTYVLEPLHEEQERFVVARSRNIDRRPRLIDPPRTDDLPPLPERYALVVHSGSTEEVTELIDYAAAAARAEGTQEPIVAVTQAAVSRRDVVCIDAYPATRLAARATRIITAAGFNCMRQFASDPRHTAVPFRRRFDDQFLRAARARGQCEAARSALECGSLLPLSER